MEGPEEVMAEGSMPFWRVRKLQTGSWSNPLLLESPSLKTSLSYWHPQLNSRSTKRRVSSTNIPAGARTRKSHRALLAYGPSPSETVTPLPPLPLSACARRRRRGAFKTNQGGWVFVQHSTSAKY